MADFRAAHGASPWRWPNALGDPWSWRIALSNRRQQIESGPLWRGRRRGRSTSRCRITLR